MDKNLKSAADQEMAFCPYGHEAAPIRRNDANAGKPCPDSANDQHQRHISAVVAVSWKATQLGYPVLR